MRVNLAGVQEFDVCWMEQLWPCFNINRNEGSGFGKETRYLMDQEGREGSAEREWGWSERNEKQYKSFQQSLFCFVCINFARVSCFTCRSDYISYWFPQILVNTVISPQHL